MKTHILDVTISLGNVVLVISAIGGVLAFAAWWLSKFLEDKKNEVNHDWQLRDLHKRVTKLEREREKEIEERLRSNNHQ